jgi:hypothetical protein
MPTGYTEIIEEGCSFEQFALRCARAFAVLSPMREAPMDAPIPEKFEVSGRYTDRLNLAKKELERVRALTLEQAADAAQVDFERSKQSYEHLLDSEEERRARYEVKLAEVKAWKPPTPDHRILREFMLEQVMGSMRFCDFTSYAIAPSLKTASLWLGDALERANRELENAREDLEREIENARKRTEWVAALRGSLRP